MDQIEGPQFNLVDMRNARHTAFLVRDAIDGQGGQSNAVSTLRSKKLCCACCGEPVDLDHESDSYNQMIHNDCIRISELYSEVDEQDKLNNPEYEDMNEKCVRQCKTEAGIPLDLDSGWNIHPNGLFRLDTDEALKQGWRSETGSELHFLCY